MKTLEHQLAALGTHLDEGHRPIAPDEVLSGRFETAPSSEPRSRWWVAVVAAAAVLVLIGGSTWILRGDAPEVADEPVTTITVTPEVTVTTEMPPPTTVQVTEAPDVPITEGAPASWMQVDVGDLVGGTVVTGPMGMVAIGTNTELSGTSWFSADGETWQRLAVPRGMDVAYGDPGFVICCHDTGMKGDLLSRKDSSFSTDGIDWFTTQFEIDGSDQRQPGTYQSMDTVTFGNGKFVALGEVLKVDDRLEPEVYSFGVWHSDDGQNWTAQSLTAVPLDDLQDDLACIMPPDCWNLDVTFGHAGFVAVGAGTWHSPDGTTWIRVQGPRFGDGWGQGPTVTYVNGAYFAIGGAEAQDEPRDAIWRSTDGLAWEMVLVNPDWGTIADVVYGNQGYLVVGSSGDTGAAVWHSPDGVTWTGPNHDPDVFTDTWFHAAGYIDGRYVIFGEANGASPQYGRLFISE